MSVHIFNNLAELLYAYLAAKIGRWVLSKDLMDRECNYYLPYKVNRQCVYEGKFWSKCLIYEVKCSMCDAIYIGNTQQELKKIMDGHFSDLLRPLNNGQISDLFAAHLEHQLNSTMSRIYLRKYMTFKVVNELNTIGTIKYLQNPTATYEWRNV